jgi:hypothetical protein
VTSCILTNEDLFVKGFAKIKQNARHAHLTGHLTRPLNPT